ncbi:hypothetical protein ACFR99_00115 [Haloarchaeobius amylolyticus]|uniref:Uncharacterized protein n=1 Tax=Haloarchaeobius amylolyticus TaxID=1198296 RepID=A0ABD6BA93_9EURY
MPVFEVVTPAVVGGVDGVTIIGWVSVVAMLLVIGFLVYLALGPGTQSYQAERAEPTPTDDSGVDDTGAEERSDTPTESRSD